MTVRLLLFGSPAVDDDGESSALAFERRHQLLAYLALRRAWVPRTELAAMLWPGLENKLAFTNLRKILFRLQALPWARVDAQGGSLRFDTATDVADFEAALREGRIAEALALRRGELLAGFDDDASDTWSSWLHFERDRLRLAWRGAALERLALDLDAAEGIELSARALDADPLDEAALRAHMSWLARGGQSARARAAYREFVARLSDELGLPPGTELKALHDALGAAVAASPGAPPKRPESDEGFVGRSMELRRIAALIAQEGCRLLSLIGPGGIGKTRLARRALDELAPHYPDGVAFIPVEDIAAATALGGRIARELGVTLSGSDEPLAQVIAFLRERAMLIVLDNFEHLVADAPLLERLLRECPRVAIIVTSRVRLGLAAEQSLPIEGLPYPEPEDQDRAESFDAVRLFVQTAQRVEPALVPAVEAASIVDICRQVEGLPLALELAAAWTRVLSCQAIAAELREGSELLQASDSAHPARHASIEVVFEQSWRLLGAVERDALSRLSVFRGGFPTEAARMIAGASLPVLRALADKSLLRKEDTRIFMHPLVQQLAALRLGHGPERDATERAHAQYFHRLLAELSRAVEDGGRDALLGVETEFENCRTAWRWAIAHDAGDMLAKSTPALLHFCDHRGRFDEGLALLREAFEHASARDEASPPALLLAAAAHLEYRLDRYADAQASATRALARARRDRTVKLQCLKVLGSCGLRLGRHAEAKRYFAQALEQARVIDPRSAAGMLDNLALVEKTLGRYDEALRLSLQSLVEHQRMGDAAGEALCLNNLGALYLDRREYASASAQLRQGLAISERHGFVGTRALLLANLAECAMKTGDFEAAETHARRALEVAEAGHNRALTCWLKLQFVQFALRRGDWAAARSGVATAMAIAIAIGQPSLQLAGVACFAELLDAHGKSAFARRILAFAAEHPSASTAQRAEIRARLAELRPAENADPPWPGLALDELVHRIVVETDVAHAPLMAALGGR